MDFLGKALVIAGKDLLTELRTKDIVTSVLIFALLAIIIFSFSFETSAETTPLVAPGVLWVAFTFAGVVGLNRSFTLEKDKGCLEGLMLCPVDRGAIYVGKLLGALTFMLVVEGISLPVFSVLYNLPIFMPGLLLVAVMTSLGFAAIGTLFSAVASSTRARDVMLPILFLPMVVPILIAAVKATGTLMASEPLQNTSTWLQLIAAFDIIFLVISTLVFEFAITE
ncbi:MAG: heme exporter protein CcmB [Chloroflexi bacterium]|nr:heme exporter protein CcmB [Chloroflexota bacterium]